MRKMLYHPTAIDTEPTHDPAAPRHGARLALLAIAGLVALGCGAQHHEPLAIEPIDVPGPPEAWDMSSRLMNRQSASTATLGAATFERISASMYYDPEGALPFTGTFALRADTLQSPDPALREQLEAWLEPARQPAFIYQTTGSRKLDGAIEADGNLLLRDGIYPATSRWEVIAPVAINAEGRRAGELRGTILATVPGSPFAEGELRLVLTLPVAGYTVGYVEGLLAQKGIQVGDIIGDSPSYPSDAAELSDVAWYLMLAGRLERALEVFQMSIDKSAELNTYMRMADCYVFSGRYDMAVGTYVALQEQNLGHPHSLELIKLLAGKPLGVEELAAINAAWAGS